MQELNKAFLPAGIQFYMGCPSIDTIDSYYLYHFNTDFFSNDSNISNTINIYYSNTIKDGVYSPAGIGTFPHYSKDYITV